MHLLSGREGIILLVINPGVLRLFFVEAWQNYINSFILRVTLYLSTPSTGRVVSQPRGYWPVGRFFCWFFFAEFCFLTVVRGPVVLVVH